MKFAQSAGNSDREEDIMRANLKHSKKMPRYAGAIVVIAATLASMSASATTYYIDNSSKAASDNNAGTSPSAPWATL